MSVKGRSGKTQKMWLSPKMLVSVALIVVRIITKILHHEHE